MTDADCAGNATCMGGFCMGGNIYVPPPQQQQTITFTSTPPTNATVGSGTYIVTAAGGASGNPVTFSASPSSVCTGSGPVTFVGAGTCIVTANQAGNMSYSAAPSVQQSFTITAPAKQNQTITWTQSEVVTTGAVVALTASSNSGLTPQYSVSGSNTAQCAIAGANLTVGAAGWCEVVASFAGNATFNPATSTKSFTNVRSNAPTPLPVVMKMVLAQQFDRYTNSTFASDLTSSLVANNSVRLATGITQIPTISASFGTNPALAQRSPAGIGLAGAPDAPGWGTAGVSSYELTHDRKYESQLPFTLGGPMQFSASDLDGNGVMKFRTSLAETNRYLNSQQPKTDGALGLSQGELAAQTARPSLFDIWIEGSASTFRSNALGLARNGHIGRVAIGADYLANSKVLLGVFSQLDSAAQNSDSSLQSRGWLAGPYAAVRLHDHLFWSVAAGWGSVRTNISPVLTYTDTVTGSRFYGSTSLMGNWTNGPWQFRPSASLSYIRQTDGSYVDTPGNVISSLKTDVTQATVGPEVAYKIKWSPDVTIEPRAGAKVIWNSNGGTEILDPAGNNMSSASTGARGRVELGMLAATVSGVTVDLSGSYDGVGVSNYRSLGGRAIVRVPLN